jgi:hypothetical protein
MDVQRLEIEDAILGRTLIIEPAVDDGSQPRFDFGQEQE